MPVTGTRERAVKTIKVTESAEAGKNREKSESKYPKNLAQVPCNRYLINFGNKSASVFFDLGSQVNAVYLTFSKKLSFSMRPTDIGVQKIVGSMLDIFRMVLTSFSVIDKANQVRFFEETFLMANVSLEIVLGIPFLTLSSADIDFLG